MNSFREELVALVNKWLADGASPVSMMKTLSEIGAQISGALFREGDALAKERPSSADQE